VNLSEALILAPLNRKQGRLLGGWVTRHYKIDWQSSHAVLLAFKSASMTGTSKTISLEQ
jgi:hypothetical protein